MGERFMRKIFLNGKFHTMDQMHPLAEAVVVENGRFIDLGDSTSMKAHWNHGQTEVVDLQGAFVTPGLTDSHLHIAGIAENIRNLNVTDCTSADEMLAKIKAHAEQLEKGEWIVGRGWDENEFNHGTIPTIEELNRVAPANPMFISRICGHASLVNSKALDVCNIHANITVPEGGTIVLDEATGKPSGLFLEAASGLIQKHIPNPSYEAYEDSVREAIKFTMSKGLTSVHTNDPRFLGGLEQTYAIYDTLLNKEKLGLRCNLLIDHEFMDDIYEQGMYTGYGNETLSIGAVKIFADGAIGRRTALLSEPYSDALDQYGDAMYSQDALTKIVKQARGLGMPIAVHVIGDQALENMLNVLDQFPTVAYRDRLIHVQVLREDLIKRLAAPSRIADIQPRFLAGDFPWVQDRLGDERSKLAYAWKTLMNAGVICAGGSDCPVEPVDPLLGLHAAVTRKRPDENHNGYFEKEKLTMEEALGLFTKMGAYPTNEETIKGTITRGKLADLTVFDRDLYNLSDPDELLETNIQKTIIGGNTTFEQ